MSSCWDVRGDRRAHRHTAILRIRIAGRVSTTNWETQPIYRRRVFVFRALPGVAARCFCWSSSLSTMRGSRSTIVAQAITASCRGYVGRTATATCNLGLTHRSPIDGVCVYEPCLREFDWQGPVMLDVSALSTANDWRRTSLRTTARIVSSESVRSRFLPARR